MAKQTEEQMATAIDGIASKVMGVEPAQAAAPPPPKEKDSPQDKAAETGSPETEGDKIVAEAIVFEMDMGDGKKRPLTEQQIQGTFDRYKKLNYQQMQMKPVNDVLVQLMQRTGKGPKEMAEMLKNVEAAAQSNPTMGNTEGDKSGPPYDKSNPQDMDAQLAKWEEDNAATLPPMYREAMMQSTQGTAAMAEKMNRMEQMLQMVLAKSEGNVQAAREGMAAGQQQQADAIQRTIGNNLDRVQQSLGLSDDKANDFKIFAAERGYTMEDFVDPRLTYKVMADFKNNMNSDEMERMRQIASRRQAFTGSLGSTPSASSAAEPAPAETRLDQMTSAAMAKKGLA